MAVAEDDRELELVALARLGLGGRLGPDSGSASGEPLLDSLVRSGALARHQARAVRAYVARFEVRCSCGKRALASESTRALPCPGCGAALVRESSREVWTARPARPLPGTGSRIGPLELLEALGKGATATVYRARHTVLGRTSAVKVIPLAALDARKRRRFEREMKAVGRLRHPGIVPIHAAFEVGDALACEMDLVPGRTLEEVAADAGLPWREAAEMVARIAEAVSHAHRAGVLHRDLKPPNVLVRETDRAPFVVDFGLARLTDEASSLTRVGAFVGTPLYMAPEAFRGESTEATDIYGLGAILYYALTGHPPFEAASPEVLLYRVSRGLCEKTAASGAPADLERVRAQAMAVDPDDRFATAAEMASDLRRILGGAPIRAEPRRVSRRRRAILAGVAAVALVALATRSLVAPGAGEREAPVASVADALSVLASGKQGAARRAEALHVLTAASAIDLAALDSAVALAPSDEELRALRVAACRKARSPLDVDDLVRAAEHPIVGDPELLAAHALRHGLRGDDALAKLRSVRTRLPSSRGVALLYGTWACLSGDASLRAEAEKALEDGRPGDDGPQRVLLRTLGEAGSFSDLLVAPEPRGDAALRAVTEWLERDVKTIARDLPRAIPVVLAPVGSAARVALADRKLDALHPEVGRAVVAVLGPALDASPPAFVALYAMIRDIVRGNGPDVTPLALARAGEAIVGSDPLVAASALELAATAESEGSNGSLDEGALVRRWFALAESALEALSHRPVRPSDFESFWRLNVIRRCAAGISAHELRVASHETDPELVHEHLVAALEHGWRSFDIVRHEGGLASMENREAAKLARILFLLGREAECEPLLPSLSDRELVRAEMLRRRGDARGALDVVAAAIPAAEPAKLPDLLAARILAEADLGDLAAAKADLDRLRTTGRPEAPLLDHLGTNAATAYVAEKVKR
ncbi:MAG TPA: serine/threonine-protein kinase [Planctomycetota bacterium]|nr:serine/threonine-protein kinase [Planctomycetota bacterium]